MSESADEFTYIIHYKKSIEKNSEDRNRILHCLQKIAKLKISVAHLQQTGIGKTVNNVRKLEGEVGELAKTLVMKWKDMVAADEKAEKMKPPVPLFKLPIKLEPQEFDEAPMQKITPIDIFHTPIKEENHRKSSSSSNNSKSKHKTEDKHHHSSRSSGSKSSEKKDENRKSSKSSSSDKSKHHHSKSHQSSSSHSENSSKRKHEDSSKENESSQKKPKLEIKTEIKKELSKSSSSSSSSSSKSSSKHKEKTVKQEEVTQDEVDESHGIGFAEALAFFDMPSSSSTSKKKEAPMADKMLTIPSSSKSSSSKSSENGKRSLKNLTAPPKLLVQKPKLEPLPDIVNDLPSDVSIPEYRPAPLNAAVKDYINSSVLGAQYMKPPQRNMSDADLLTESFSSKANRTRVFSGNRVQKTVPSLFEMCIRVLQENIDFLTETGGVPFDILRPVLERAKPEQLNVIEYYNSYILDESDVLWEPHCKRKFRSRKREEMESWREMYDRCTREDDEKLSRLTKNIKQHQEKADGGVQKTKLAYVDQTAKAPRNVRHKQEIYGTNNKVVVSPAMRTVGLRNLQPNMAAVGDARLRVSAGLRDDAQQSGRRQVKACAPMMAKILSKFKR